MCTADIGERFFCPKPCSSPGFHSNSLLWSFHLQKKTLQTLMGKVCIITEGPIRESKDKEYSCVSLTSGPTSGKASGLSYQSLSSLSEPVCLSLSCLMLTASVSVHQDSSNKISSAWCLINNRDFFLTVWRLEVQDPDAADSVSGEATLPGWQTVSSRCILILQKGRGLFLRFLL